MTSTLSRPLLLVGALALSLVTLFRLPAAEAMPAKVAKAFKGQILVTAEPLEAAETEKATIAAWKKARLAEVTGSPNADDVVAWYFRYTAVLKAKGFTALTLEFYADGKLVADQRLEGVDPTSPVLEGEVQITEDDGPSRGKTYTIKLVGVKGGKDVAIAATKLTLK